MLRTRLDPFPFAAVRDLLGILRAFWLATDSLNERHRNQIAAVAQELRAAYELALTSSPNTMGYSAAWQRAEAATRKVGNLVDMLTAFEPVVRAAAERVVGLPGGIRRKNGPTH